MWYTRSATHRSMMQPTARTSTEIFRETVETADCWLDKENWAGRREGIGVVSWVVADFTKISYYMTCNLKTIQQKYSNVTGFFEI